MHDAFRTRFDGEASGIWSAPGRVNLIGEHTDYNGGVALPFAIDRRTRVAVRLRDDRLMRAASTLDIDVFTADLDSGAAFAAWTPYLFGVARILAEGLDPSQARGFDVLVDSTIPIGVGVSSSHALECAMAAALVDLWQLPLTAHDLISVTHRVEHEIVGAPTGTLDQSAILLGEADHGVLLDFGAGSSSLVPLGFDDARLSVLVIDSTQRHDHSAGGYRRRREECEEAARIAGVSALGEIAVDDIATWRSRMPDAVFRRMRHIVTDSDRARQVAALVQAGSPEAIGTLLTAGHRSERDDFEISTPAIDTAVDAAVAAGALGARLTGGGFGGASIALVHTADIGTVSSAVANAVTDAGHPRPDVFAVRASRGAGRDA